jgi:hypothetical protein
MSRPTRGITKAYEAALAKDYPAQVLPMVHQRQVEEEAWADEMVARAEASTTQGGCRPSIVISALPRRPRPWTGK